MASPKVPLSVVIPARNEAKNLPRCIGSVAWAEEIWVVDSQSADGTPLVAAAAGAKVAQFRLVGDWPKKKNWALDNLPLAHEWVLILDADETLPPEAEAEIRGIVTDASHPCDGYWINRRFLFMGRWLRHAYYPNWNLRLFRHARGRYERLAWGPTQSGDNEIHEQVRVNGPTGRLRAEMDHFAFPSIEAFVEKHNRYSNWEAAVASGAVDRKSAELPTAGRTEPADAWFRRRRRLNRLKRRLPFRPTLRFLYVYLWQRGILDGPEGYYFARLHAGYEFLCVAKARELARKADTMTDSGG